MSAEGNRHDWMKLQAGHLRSRTSLPEANCGGIGRCFEKKDNQEASIRPQLCARTAICTSLSEAHTLRRAARRDAEALAVS